MDGVAEAIPWKEQVDLYSAAQADLEKAAQNGVSVEGELRFVEVDGNLIVKRPEDYLTGDLKIKPIFDLKQGKAISQ